MSFLEGADKASGSFEANCMFLVVGGENMEGAIHMVTFWEGADKASGSFEANCMFLVVEGACA
eukprot:811020-Pelagomonas_calceolata.AAC.1